MSFTTLINKPITANYMFIIALSSLLMTACGDKSSSTPTTSDQASTDETTSNQASTNETTNGQASINETTSDQANINETTSDQANINETTSDQASTNTSTNEGCSNFTQQKMLDEVNRVRAKGRQCHSGYKPPASKLVWEGNLAKSAIGHARDMAENNYFSHLSQDGRTFKQRLKNVGYTGNIYAENIAAGTSSIAQTVEQLLISTDGHCETLMSTNYTEIGMACAFNQDSYYGHYWAQEFGKKL